MDRFQFAQKAFITNRGRLLLVQKSSQDPHNPGLWEVPGGRMEFGENIADHIRREVKEEVGIDIEPGPPFHIWQWMMTDPSSRTDDRIQVIAVARTCEALSSCTNSGGQREDDFLSAIEWVPLEDLARYNVIPSLRAALDRFVELAAADRRQSASGA